MSTQEKLPGWSSCELAAGQPPHPPTYSEQQNGPVGSAPPISYVPTTCYPPGQPQYVIDGRMPTHTVVTQQQIVVQQSSCMINTVPVMPKWLAVVLCIINCLLPGMGTVGASFTFCCYKRPEEEKKNCCDGTCCHCCGTFCIGWAQLATAPFFFLGWIWSIMWGVAFVQAADRAVIITSTTTEQFVQQDGVANPGYDSPA